MKYPTDIPILELAILEMGRLQRGKTFCPSEVVRWIFPEAWSYFMDEVNEEMMRLYQEGKIIVTQSGIPVDPLLKPKGPVRIMLKNQT